MATRKMTAPRFLVLVMAALAAAPARTEEPATQLRVQLVDGTLLVGTPDVATVRVKSSVGELDIAFEKLSSITRADGGIEVNLADGNTLHGTLVTESFQLKTKFGSIKIERDKIRSVERAAGAPQPPPADPALPAEGVGGSAPSDGLPLRPAASLRMQSRLAVGRLSPDGGTFWIVPRPGRILALDAASLDIRLDVRPEGGASLISLAPGGKTVAAAGSSAIWSLDASSGKALAQVALDKPPSGLFAWTDDLAIIATETEYQIVSFEKRNIVRRIAAKSRAVSACEGGRRLLAPGGELLVAEGAADPERLGWMPYGNMPMDPGIFFSPDGRWSLGEDGTAWRVGRSYRNPRLQAGKLPCRVSAVAWRSTIGTVLTFEESGRMRETDLGSLEELQSVDFGLRVVSAVFDSASGSLWVIGRRPTTSRGPPDNMDLFRFTLK
ncbi:MAG: hypothetical protein K8T20_08730 [Planctomycetes bacterium]|nr:hypothetical protein [Planctomycetota bacterium]